jgi:hypothetical protein
MREPWQKALLKQNGIELQIKENNPINKEFH